jgi:hypothetical protein
MRAIYAIVGPWFLRGWTTSPTPSFRLCQLCQPVSQPQLEFLRQKRKGQRKKCVSLTHRHNARHLCDFWSLVTGWLDNESESLFRLCHSLSWSCNGVRVCSPSCCQSSFCLGRSVVCCYFQHSFDPDQHRLLPAHTSSDPRQTAALR